MFVCLGLGAHCSKLSGRGDTSQARLTHEHVSLINVNVACSTRNLNYTGMHFPSAAPSYAADRNCGLKVVAINVTGELMTFRDVTEIAAFEIKKYRCRLSLHILTADTRKFRRITATFLSTPRLNPSLLTIHSFCVAARSISRRYCRNRQRRNFNLNFKESQGPSELFKIVLN